jgi:hypothetical protein
VKELELEPCGLDFSMQTVNLLISCKKKSFPVTDLKNDIIHKETQQMEINCNLLYVKINAEKREKLGLHTVIISCLEHV